MTPRNHTRAITTCLLALCLLVVGLFLCSRQSVTYDTRVSVVGTITGADAEGNTENDAICPDGTTTAQRSTGAQNVTVTIAGVSGSTAKPIEVSPGRELSPAREAVVSDNVVEGLPTP
jgi:hypothetical protein